MRVKAATFIACILLVAAACGGREDLNPPCTIGKPCEIEIDAGYTSNGQPCVGAPPYDNEQPSCICICPAGSDDAGAEANEIPDSSATTEAGVCGSRPAGECNQLANVGTMITPTCVVSTPPAMSGGAIADGTYVLVSVTDYASSCSGVPLPGGGPVTILVSAGCCSPSTRPTARRRTRGQRAGTRSSWARSAL